MIDPDKPDSQPQPVEKPLSEAARRALAEAEARRRSTENAKAAASAIPINADEGGFHETRQ